jgi:hypothetical protein
MNKHLFSIIALVLLVLILSGNILVKTTEADTSHITVQSPNGGEVLLTSRTYPITWSATTKPEGGSFDIYLVCESYSNGCAVNNILLLKKGVSYNSNAASQSWNWNLTKSMPNNIRIWPERFKVAVCPKSFTPNNADKCDTSNNWFIVSTVPIPPASASITANWNHDPIHPVSLAADNNPASFYRACRFYSDVNTNYQSGNVVRDLGSVKSISQIGVDFTNMVSPQSWATYYTVDISNDKVTWNTVYRRAAGDSVDLNWLPNAPTSARYVRINYSSVGTGGGWCVGINEFKITTAPVAPIASPTPGTFGFTIISPNGGETFSSGAIARVKFNQRGYWFHLQIISSTAGPVLDTWFFGSDTKAEGDLYYIDIPLSHGIDLHGTNLVLPAGQYKMQLTYTLSDSNPNHPTDTSDNWFTITASATNPSLQVAVVAPNGGESYVAGNSFNFSFTTATTLSGIPYTRSLIGEDGTIIPITVSGGSVPLASSMKAQRYKAKICINASTGPICDTSDNWFTVTAPTNRPLVTVLRPDGEYIVERAGTTLAWESDSVVSPFTTYEEWIISENGSSNKLYDYVATSNRISVFFPDYGYGSFYRSGFGKYKLKVCIRGYSDAEHCDTSDNWLTYGPATSQPSIASLTVRNLVGGSKVEAGGGIRISWQAQNAPTGSKVGLKVYRNGTFYYDYGYSTSGSFTEAPKTPCVTVATSLLGSGYEIRAQLYNASGVAIPGASRSVPFTLAQRTCGTQPTTNRAPQIVSGSIPTTAVVGSPVTVNFTASDPDNNNLGWSVDWGVDRGGSSGSCNLSPNTPFSATYTYTQPGNYTISTIVSDCNGATATRSQTIVVSEQSVITPPLSFSGVYITNLTGGSTIQAGGGVKIGWRVSGAPSGARIVLKIFRNGSLYHDYGLVSGNPFIEAAKTPCAPVSESLIGGGYEIRAYLNDANGNLITTASAPFAITQRNCTAASLSLVQMANIMSALDEIMAALRNL